MLIMNTVEKKKQKKDKKNKRNVRKCSEKGDNSTCQQNQTPVSSCVKDYMKLVRKGLLSKLVTNDIYLFKSYVYKNYILDILLICYM